MAQDISVSERVRLAQAVAVTLNNHGVRCVATFWDRKSSDGDWQLRIILEQEPSSGIDFLMQLITLRGFGDVPAELDLASVRPAGPGDARAEAVVSYARAIGKTAGHVQAFLLGQQYFEEVVIGYISPDYPAVRSAA